MSIASYKSMIEEIQNKLLSDKLKHKNTIIIGENSSGKSEILKQILESKKHGYYLIDSVNRKFDYSKVSYMDSIPLGSYKKIIKRRLEDDAFNLKDTFDLYGDGNKDIEQVYFNYDKELKSLFKKFLNIEIDIKKASDEKIKITIGRGINKISNGYQAILRLFLEIIYFRDSLEKTVKKPVVVIDEINEFLSGKNGEKILPFLMNEFKEFNFIVTTHSTDVIVNSINCNILFLKGNICEYM